MSKADKTRDYIIEKAAPVFNKKGYAGTSLTDLIQVTGLTKGSIYGNFENKDEIALAVFKHSLKNLNTSIATYLQDQKTSTNKLKAFTEYYRIHWKKIFEKGGCVIQNASVEADDNITLLKKSVQASILSWVKWMSKIIEQGQKNNEFKKQLNVSQSAYSIITILEGGILLSKIMNDKKHLFNALERIDTLIHTELKR